ncbi:MAG: glycosyltransferase [Spirochaetaceae bacterium]|nr:glycosyltransferase [Spirochaetaceae bacterium]
MIKIKTKIHTVIKILRRYGLRGFVFAIFNKLRGRTALYGVDDGLREAATVITYEEWIAKNEYNDAELQKQREVLFAYAPKISIVTPLYLTPQKFLVDLLESVCSQTYSNWELCLVDAKNESSIQEIVSSYSVRYNNIRYKKLECNLGISENTNQGLEMTTGAYVIFLDHDDTLSPFALYEVVKALNNKEIDVIYSDLDKITQDGEKRVEPFFKPQWSLEYFRSVMYVGHLLCVKKALLLEINGFDKTYDGVQDFELMLRLSEKTSQVYHIPKILYHWRISESSIAGNINAKSTIDDLQRKAVNAHLLRCQVGGTAVSVGYHRLRIIPNKKSYYPKVSVIVPNKTAPELISKCLQSIYGKTSYPNFEVIIGNSGTTGRKKISSRNVIEVECSKHCNYSEIKNLCAKNSSGEYLVFLNNNTEIVTDNWLEEMLFYAERNDAGAVGALLVYPDMTVQHAGIALGMGGAAGHLMQGFPYEADGYYGSLKCVREVSAVSTACLMIKKRLFFDIDGFNQHYAACYHDVDLCCTLLSAGYKNIINPNAIIKHYESRAGSETYNMVDRYVFLDKFWQLVAQGDRYYNVNLDLQKGNYQIGEQHKKNTFCPIW